MSRESNCRCLICGLERSLTLQLADSRCQEGYRQFADSRSLLSAFPSTSDLIAHLHACRNTNSEAHSSDRILAELLQPAAADRNVAMLRDLLLLAFIPMLHSASRQVTTRYPSLSTDDVAQHVVTALLQIVGSPEFYGRGSHVAFAISRILKRNAFEWAERECRPVMFVASLESKSESLSIQGSPEPVERVALLRHFLYRCHQRGLLTDEELELLVQFKLDATRDARLGGPAAVYSNASRQRMKRLLTKLRRIAQPRSPKGIDAQLHLF